MTTLALQRAMLGAFSDADDPGPVQRVIESLLGTSDEALEAELAARVRVAGARLFALKHAATEDEFDKTFDLVARPRLLLEFAAILQHEAFAKLSTSAQVDLRGEQPTDLVAMEYAADVMERAALLAQKAPSSLPRGSFDSIARYFTSFTALALAAYDPKPWKPWMVGMLWNLGRRSTVEMAHFCGLSWEEATDLLVTKRDRAMAAKPFDQAASDEACRTLGLH
jgi:hypothetical protein